MIIDAEITPTQEQHALLHANEIPHRTDARDGSCIVTVDIPADAAALLHLKIDGKTGRLRTDQLIKYPTINDGKLTTQTDGWGRVSLNSTYVRLNDLIRDTVIAAWLAEPHATLHIAAPEESVSGYPTKTDQVFAPILDAIRRGNSEGESLVQEEQARQDEKRAVEQAEREQREAAAAAEKAREKRESDARQAAANAYRDAWIAEKGSPALRLGHEKGYACQKRFEQEWGAVELGPDYVLDYNGVVTAKDRSCPSESALKEQVRIESLNLPGVTVQVCWLPRGLTQLKDDVDYDSEDSCEAIEVQALDAYYYRVFP